MTLVPAAADHPPAVLLGRAAIDFVSIAARNAVVTVSGPMRFPPIASPRPLKAAR
jgi:hypothetical protein